MVIVISIPVYIYSYIYINYKMYNSKYTNKFLIKKLMRYIYFLSQIISTKFRSCKLKANAAKI